MDFSSESAILIGSVLLFISLLMTKPGYRYGIPALLLFLLIGMLAGSEGLLKLEFSNPENVQFIGVIALCVILFSGGMDTKYEDIKPVAAQGIILSTVGVLLTALLTGAFIYVITNHFFDNVHFTWLESLLLASVMSSTDSASVFAILRSKGLRLKQNLRPMLELESGSNDPMAYMLTITIIQLLVSANMSTGVVIGMFMLQLTIGAIAGYFLGRLCVLIINKINMNNDALYPILLLAFTFFIFSFTDFIKGNGYLAVYVGGLVVGNSQFVHKKSMRKFFEGLSWLCQIVMFLALGLLVNPSELLPIAGIGLLIGFFMIIVSRPISVFAGLVFFRKMTVQARVYVSWVGLRGAVPIIFATYPLIEAIEHPQIAASAKIIFNIVFFITIVSLLVQGTTVSKVAKWLGLSEEAPKRKQLSSFEMDFSEEIKSAMTEITITDEILKDGNRLMEIPLPDKTLAVMVKRGKTFFIPRGNTVIEKGDIMLVITDDEEALKQTYEELGIKNYYHKS